jgi:hypothetical protein
MPTPEENLKTLRFELLKALKDPTRDTEDLNAAILKARQKAPDLFEPHVDMEGFAINEDPLIWRQWDDYHYFTKQKKGAERNFSEERWRHLATMRAYFREKGWQGFAPRNAPPKAAPKTVADVPESRDTIAVLWDASPSRLVVEDALAASSAMKIVSRVADAFKNRDAIAKHPGLVDVIPPNPPLGAPPKAAETAQGKAGAPSPDSTQTPSSEKENTMHQASDRKASDTLKRNVKDNDVTAVRVGLEHALTDMRLSRQDLQEILAWVTSKLDIFEPFRDGQLTRPINLDSTAWDVNYHDLQMVSLENNFSKERFLHVLDVREHLRDKGDVPQFKPIKETPRKQAPKDSARTGPAGTGIPPWVKVGGCVGGGIWLGGWLVGGVGGVIGGALVGGVGGYIWAYGLPGRKS